MSRNLSAPEFATKTALRRLMKQECNIKLVSMPAILKLKSYLEDLLIKITKESLKITYQNKRKTVLLDDIKEAGEIFNRLQNDFPLSSKKYFSWSPMRTIMALNGAKLVSKDAVDYVLEKFQDLAITISKKAEEIKEKTNLKKTDEQHMVQAIAEIGNACPKCGALLRTGAKFCDKCGTQQDPSCPKCGIHLRSGARFCDNCGERIY
ncbi:MAG: zinc-ribbon domain-containing protein [Candidatus Helarchaeota archaeon]